MKFGRIDMIIQEPAQFINEFIDSINNLSQKKNPGNVLSRKQCRCTVEYKRWRMA